MSELQIRTALPADAIAVSAMIHRAVRTSNAADYEPAVIELICANFEPDKFIERMAERDVFAGVQGDRIVATVSFSKARSKLYSLYVEPELHRQGVGVRLVRHVEQHATAAGVSVLWLSASITARPFYERLGYTTHRFEERLDGSTYLMGKALTA
jgi:predicted N-acetyltransferase YhbS